MLSLKRSCLKFSLESATGLLLEVFYACQEAFMSLQHPPPPRLFLAAYGKRCESSISLGSKVVWHTVETRSHMPVKASLLSTCCVGPFGTSQRGHSICQPATACCVAEAFSPSQCCSRSSLLHLALLSPTPAAAVRPRPIESLQLRWRR